MTPSPRSALHRSADMLLIAGFFILLVCPTMVYLISDDQTVSKSEKRTLASPPRWATLVEGLPRFRREFEAYIEDHIGLREAAIELNSKIKILAFNISPSPLAIIGRDRWIYLWARNSRKQSAKRDFRGDYRISPMELDRWYLNHMAITEDLRRRGVHYLLVIAPNKQSIYPEYLPLRTRSRAGQTILDQYSAYLANKDVAGWLNLKPTFLAMKSERQMYMRSDSHWNENGFLHAYRRIVDWSQQRDASIPDSKTDSELDFKTIERRGDLVYIVGFASRFMESITSVTPIDPCASIKEDIPLQEYGLDARYHAYLYRCRTGSGKMMFVHDSFGIPVEPLLAEHYAEMIASHNGNPLELDRLISQSDPDFFVHLRVERELSALFPRNPELTGRYVSRLFDARKDQRLRFNLSPDNLECGNCDARQTGSGTTIDAANNDPHIQFRQMPQTDFGNSVTIKLELTTPAANTVKVYYATSGDPVFAESRTISAKLISGRNTKYLRIVSREPLINFRLDPGDTATTYLLHDFSLIRNGRN